VEDTKQDIRYSAFPVEKALVGLAFMATIVAAEVWEFDTKQE
jgi:hypothetical protein